MNKNNLITMANQIGSFYETMPDRAQALADTAGHFQKFWDPRMRRALLTVVDSNEEAGLLPIVVESLQLHRALLAV